MNQLANPYQFSNPVYRDGEFFNRNSELQRIRRAISAQRSVELIGQFRVGKSSILRRLNDYAGGIFDNPKIIPVYYDLSRRPQIQNSSDFFSRLWSLISSVLVTKGESEATLPNDINLADPIRFEEYINRWYSREYRFLILLDEFGIIATNQTFDFNFFDNVRNSCNTLNYIFSVPLSLSIYSHPNVRSSPLFNLTQVVKLRLFEDESSISNLINEPANRASVFWTEDALRFINDRGGYHPCYLQLACSTLFDSYIQNHGSIDYQESDLIFKETAEEHFKYFWSKTLEDQERPELKEYLRNSLIDLVRGNTIDENAEEELLDRSLIWKNKQSGSIEPLSPWFGEWIKKRTTSSKTPNRTESFSKDEPKVPVNHIESGQVLNNQYEVLRIIGKKEFSQVAMAWDINLKRIVAIKCLTLEKNENIEIIQKLKENLKREGDILANLKHSSIGQIYGFLNDPPGIVMEWIYGVSLQDILEAKGEFSIRQVLDIGIVLADALTSVHKQEVYHRDIKPNNIILTVGINPVLKPVIIDFDIARATTRSTISLISGGRYKYFGTPEYSAPEQFLNPEGVGASTDIFSLAIVLYELLTLMKPYKNGNLPSLYIGGKFPVPEQHGIPEKLFNVLCSMLVEQPELRPSALDVKHELIFCREAISSIES